MSSAHILVVEDNKELAAAICLNLEREGHNVAVVHDGVSAVDVVRSRAPDLIVLDLMLPGMDGFTVLETIRDDGFAGPVLVLTARGEESDKVRGFRAGADQYLTKPFGLLELLERAKSLLKRRPGAAAAVASSAPSILGYGDVTIDLAARTISRNGLEIGVTPRAFDLLVELVRRKGVALSRLDLMQNVWGHRSAVMSRTVDVHIAELRRKLEDDPARPHHIRTVWKKGYRLVS